MYFEAILNMRNDMLEEVEEKTHADTLCVFQAKALIETMAETVAEVKANSLKKTLCNVEEEILVDTLPATVAEVKEKTLFKHRAICRLRKWSTPLITCYQKCS